MEFSYILHAGSPTVHILPLSQLVNLIIIIISSSSFIQFAQFLPKVLFLFQNPFENTSHGVSCILRLPLSGTVYWIFLVFDVLQSYEEYCVLPVPALESEFFLKIASTFYCKIVLETKIRTPGRFIIASRVWLLLSSLS